jgi:type I restriction enzyme S subunit
MQDLLTKGIDENGNIRNEKTHKFKDSPLGKIPEEWEVVRLGEVSKTITKGTTPTTYGFSYVNDGINFIKIESIDENGNFIIEKFEHIDKKTNDYLSRSKLEEGDILFSIAGALGRVAIIEKSVLPANTNQALAIIRLKEKKETTIKFLKFYLTSFLIQNYIENILVKSAQSNLTLKHISNFLIPSPAPRTTTHCRNTFTNRPNHRKRTAIQRKTQKNKTRAYGGFINWKSTSEQFNKGGIITCMPNLMKNTM